MANFVLIAEGSFHIFLQRISDIDFIFIFYFPMCLDSLEQESWSKSMFFPS